MLSNQQIIEMAPAAGALAPIAGVSDRYDYVSTIEAVELLRDEGWFPIAATQSMTRKYANEGFQRHMIRFSQGNYLDTGEERVDLMLVNSHNRDSAFKMLASLWRKACANGIMVSSNLAEFAHKHINFDSEAFAHSASMIAGQAGAIARRVDDFKEIELSPEERVLFAETAHKVAYPNNNLVPAGKLLAERRWDDKGKDLWTTFNVVQENVIKGGATAFVQKKSGKWGNATTKPVKSLERDVKLNQALWTLTEKMAELKLAA